MINLLPFEDKRQIQAGRTNSLLIRYNVFLLGGLIFLGAAVGITYVYLSSTKATAQQTIADNQSKVGSYAAVKNQADQFRSNLTTAKQILDRQATYTKVILEIAQLLPQGVILQNLNLDSQTFGSPTILSAQAKNYAGALALKDAFQSSDLFSNVHFQSISTSPTPGNPYPFTINLSVTIQKGAAK
ncbi:MAG: PilN domain-containing protein [Candidatus Saccharimonadales bacterium]